MNKKENGNPVTRAELKEEVNKLDQKIDILDQKVNTLDQKVDRVALGLVNVDSRLQKVEEFLKTQATTKEDHQEVIKYLDEIVHLNENVNRRLDGHDTRISGHEHRIHKLEKASSK